MEITISLTNKEVLDIKNHLISIDGASNPHKTEIGIFIQYKIKDLISDLEQ